VPELQHRDSIAGVLAAAAGQLARAGFGGGEARREATAIWAALDGVSAGAVWQRREEAAPPGLAERFREAVSRRSSGVPFAYAVGRASFRHLELRLDRRALIPRPETEGLVDGVLQWMRARDEGRGRRSDGGWGVAVDVGTGCGCIALALATEGEFDRVIAVERSVEAAALAGENVALVAPRTPVEVRIGDLLAPCAGERCRVIVANPPYLTDAEHAALDPAVRDFEPREALASGPDGLAVTRALLAGAGRVLEPGGLLAVEVDERRADAVRGLAHAFGWSGVTIRRDLFGRSRYAFATRDGAR
jgi:release factor glutamine methyltransferase